jgi:hypothetical protein
LRDSDELTILASFQKAWAPSYANSYAICIATFAFAIAGSALHRWNLARLDKKLENRDLQTNEAEEIKGLEFSRFPRGFRYVL